MLLFHFPSLDFLIASPDANKKAQAIWSERVSLPFLSKHKHYIKNNDNKKAPPF